MPDMLNVSLGDGKIYRVPVVSDPNAFFVDDLQGNALSVTPAVGAELYATVQAWELLGRLYGNADIASLPSVWDNVLDKVGKVIALDTIRDIVNGGTLFNLLTGDWASLPSSILDVADSDGVDAAKLLVAGAGIDIAASEVSRGLREYNAIQLAAQHGPLNHDSVLSDIDDTLNGFSLGSFMSQFASEITDLNKSKWDDIKDSLNGIVDSIVPSIKGLVPDSALAGYDLSDDLQNLVSQTTDIETTWKDIKSLFSYSDTDYQPLTSNGLASIAEQLQLNHSFQTPPPAPSPTPTPQPKPSVPTDDFGNSAEDASTISTDTAFLGRIETKGDTDWFRLTLQQGEVYGFAMTGGSVDGLSELTAPHIYLYDSSGVLVADASPESIDAVFHYAPSSTGTYYLEAAADTNFGTGGYAIAVGPSSASSPISPRTSGGSNPSPVRLDLQSVQSQVAEDDHSLVYRVAYTGTLTHDVKIDWSVHGTGNHPTDAQDFVSTSGYVTLHPAQDYVYIHVTPQADQVDEFDETFQLDITTLDDSVSIRNGSQGGTILNDDAGRILPNVDEKNTSLQSATVLTDEVWSRGFINTPGDVDYFAVKLQAGATYDLHVLGSSTTSLIGGSETGFVKLLHPQASLYDSNYNEIAGSFTAPVNTSEATYNFTPTQTGTYYIAVREDGNNDVGQYYLQDDIRVPVDDYAADASTMGQLTDGVPQTGNNERNGDSDWFGTDLTAGQSYSFYAVDKDSADFDFAGYSWPGWGDNLQVALRDSQGNVVATGAVVPGWQPAEVMAQLTFKAPSTGHYFLSVSDDTASQDYLVGFNSVSAVPTSSLVTSQPGAASGTDVSFSNVRDSSELDNLDAPPVDNPTLSVGGLLSTPGSSGSALKFDLSSLPHDASYAAIQLYFAGTAEGLANNPAMPMVLGTPKADWNEQSTLGQLDGFNFVNVLAAPTAPGWYTIDITDLYDAWQDGSRENTGIILLPMDMYGATSQFDSSDAADTSLHPRLIVGPYQPTQVIGTDAADFLSGDEHANHIVGMGGDDVIAGGAGDDWIDGGLGADIIDGGDGYDTVSYATSPAAVQIDLGQNKLSGGSAEGDSLLNVEIIEGSSYDDQMTGGIFAEKLIGGAGADILTGGAGADIFQDTAAGHSGDRITDLGLGDRIAVTDQGFASFAYTHSGSTLTLAGAALDIGAANPHLVLAADGAGTDLVAAAHVTGLADFDGNGHSDLLWRNTDGTLSTWSVSGNQAGNQFDMASTFVSGVSNDWKLVETLDWNGDGHSDILWRNASTGQFSIWTGGAKSWTANAYFAGGVAADWSVAAVGDLNGDGRDDIVWRQDTGAFSTWLSTGSGFQVNATFDTSVSSDWKIVGTGDFDGDGKADLLWRNASTGVFTEWRSTGSGFQVNAYVDGSVDPSWHIDAIADVDGDGKDDLIWRHDGDGTFTVWQSTGSGFTPNAYVNGSVTPTWQIAATGDYNDDGRADILWRNTADGTFSTWQSNGHGFDVNTALVGGVNTNWQIQAHDFHLG